MNSPINNVTVTSFFLSFFLSFSLSPVKAWLLKPHVGGDRVNNSDEVGMNQNINNEKEHKENAEEQKLAIRWGQLNEKEQLAVDMRFKGKTSEEIAEATGFKASYVRKLFMEGGRLREAYDDFLKYHHKGAKEVADIVIQRAKDEAPKALERMVALSHDRDNGPVCYKANEKIIELGGVSQETSLKAHFQGLSYESAKRRVNDLFQELFGKPVEGDIEIRINTIGSENEGN